MDSLQTVNDHLGSVYVFARTGSTWNEVQKLSRGTGQFGWMVQLVGNTALVSQGQSSAHVFVRNGSSFVHEQELVPSSSGYSISSLALSSDAALLGVSGATVGSSQQGVAHIFTRSGSAWMETQTLAAGDGQAGQGFGHYSAMSGNTAIVGAPFSDPRTEPGWAPAMGAAYVFSTSSTVPLPSSAPTLVGPSGQVSTAWPTYRFNPVAAATHYRLSVPNNLDEVYSAVELGCPNMTGVCAVTPVFPLAVGSTWKVRAQNSAGVGPWSSTLPISTSVILQTVTAPTAIGPKGSAPSATPTYTWNAVAGATRYVIWVNDALTARLNARYAVLAAFDPAQAGCSAGGVCSATPSSALVQGNAQWWVRAESSQWITRWSSTLSFAVPGNMPVNAKPVLLAPLNTLITGYPTYSWQPVLNATSYDLWVGDSTGLRYRAVYSAQQAGCATGAVCVVTPAVDIGAGIRHWWIQARDAQGTTPWSNPGKFEIKDTYPPHAAPVLVAPITSQVTGTLAYSWKPISNATQYYLWLNDAAGVIRHRTVYTAQAVGCASASATTCAVTPNLNLGTGFYTWWVQAQNPYGNSAWSGAGKFDVGIIQPPGAVTILSPVGGARSHMPIFTWNAVSSASEYLLQVTDVVGMREARITDCQGATCFATPFAGLAAGPVTWRIRAVNIAGSGPWSESSFTVDHRL
jgi:hypothetical protein